MSTFMYLMVGVVSPPFRVRSQDISFFCADTVVLFQLQADRRRELSAAQDLLL